MKLAFTLDAHGTCVGQLKDELLSLEEIATAWKFPFDIFVVFRGFAGKLWPKNIQTF